MGTVQPVQQKSLNNQGDFLLSLVISCKVKHYATQLREIIQTPLGKPVKLYRAYKSYTLAFNRMQLCALLPTCTTHQKALILSLIEKYHDAEIILRFTHHLLVK